MAHRVPGAPLEVGPRSRITIPHRCRRILGALTVRYDDSFPSFFAFTMKFWVRLRRRRCAFDESSCGWRLVHHVGHALRVPVRLVLCRFGRSFSGFLVYSVGIRLP